MVIRWVLLGAVAWAGAAEGDAAVLALDLALEQRWAAAGRALPPPCDDATFLRRACLDATGALPTPAEVRAFLADRDPGKRAALVDRLLERDGAADRWAQRWGDVLCVKAEFPSNLWPNGVQAYHRWLRESWRAGWTWERTLGALLTAHGSAFRDPPANFWRTGSDRSPGRYAAQVLRVAWAAPATAAAPGFAACFAQVRVKPSREWKEEIVWRERDAAWPATGAALAPARPDGAALAVAPGEDPRRACAAALIADPRCAQALANRAWRWLVGRPLAAPVDAWSAPDEPALLAVLADDLRAHALDPRRLWRVILRSRAYQAAAADDGAGDPLAATTYRVHPLDAEALLDAINAATGGGERYVSQIPEPFTVLPWDQRAVALADGSISHPFLELFGRPARASGLDDERAALTSDLQAQHLLNANHVQGKVGGRAIADLAKGGAKSLDELWLRFLSRLPAAGERAAAEAHLAEHPGAGGMADLAWALLNTVEFRCAH